MTQALRLAQQGIGHCAPNPTVGCVIEKNNQIIGLGRTAKGGRPHAETEALKMAGENARGATLYVTLEPCSHHGKTPPCAEAIINAGIARVVIACRDPNPQVNGNGIALLQKNNIEIIEGIGEAEAIEINRGFFSRMLRRRPWVILKTATSADGFIAKADGSSKWITGETARRHGHLLRAKNDAILTGSGTYLFDQPQLNVRIAGLEETSPARYVLDRRGRIEESEFTILNDASLEAMLTHMAEEGVNHLMVEAGAELSAAFLRAGLVDEIYWYRAPTLLGEGITAFHGEWEKLPQRPQQFSERSLDEDRLTVYRFTSTKSLLKA